MHSPTVSYALRTDATQEADLNVRAYVYRFILDSRAKKNAARVTSTNGDDAKGSQHDRASGTILEGIVPHEGVGSLIQDTMTSEVRFRAKLSEYGVERWQLSRV